MKTKPVVFNYLSAVTYLNDFVAFQKQQEPGFTYESWASELGFKSRSFLTMILNGERNITTQFIESFSQTVNFSKEEKDYFSLLAQHNQSPSETEQKIYLNQILEHKGRQKEQIEITNSAEFLTSPLLPKLLVLLSFQDLKRTPQGLAHFLKENPHSLSGLLQQLEKMGLAQIDINGYWIPTKNSFKVPKNFGSEALKKYHNHSLQEATVAQDQPAHLRRFRSVLLPLSEKDYQTLLEDIDALVSKTIARFDSDSLDQKRLYKLNLNLFPVTEQHQAAANEAAHNPENETRLLAT